MTSSTRGTGASQCAIPTCARPRAPGLQFCREHGPVKLPSAPGVAAAAPTPVAKPPILGCLGALALAVAVVVAFIAASGGDGNSKHNDGAVRYVKKQAKLAHGVQITVQAIQVEIKLIADAEDSSVDLYQLAQDAQRAHDELDAVRTDFATAADGSGDTLDNENEIFGGVNDLKNSMGAIVHYCGDPNPATAASVVTQFQEAVQEWDTGVQFIWSKAEVADPPLI